MIRTTPYFTVAVVLGILSGAAPSLQAQPSPTLTDFWNTNAVWISDANGIGISFWFHYPSAITNGAETWAYYIDGYYGPTGSLKAVTARARSTDGIDWTSDGMVLNVGGAPQRVYESESLLSSDHQVGRADGDGWSATKTLDSPGYLVRGPHAQDINGGTNKAIFRLLINKLHVNTNVKAVTLDVYDETASQ